VFVSAFVSVSGGAGGGWPPSWASSSRGNAEALPATRDDDSAARTIAVIRMERLACPALVAPYSPYFFNFS
jgi:hypothetical protein